MTSTTTPPITVDLLVIGAGPAGLYGTYYAGFRGMSVALMDSLPQVGGQVAALYPEKQIFDIAGFPAIKGQELIDSLYTQALQSEPILLLGQTAAKLDTHPDSVSVTTDTGITVHARAILITGGVGSFEPRELPAGSDYDGRGLRYFVPRLNDLTGHEVVIVGGGDSALDWALGLEKIAASVTLVHRRAVFRAHERSIALLADSTVRVMTPYEVDAIGGENAVAEVTLRHSKNSETVVLPATSIVAALGFIADLGPLDSWGLEQDKRRILVGRDMQTSIPPRLRGRGYQ